MAYFGPDLLRDLEDKIVSKQEELENWFAEKRATLPMPIYGSVDIRDAHWKVAVVDANQYPAGFNNLSDGDIGRHLRESIGDIRHVHIWPESHTRNPAYSANIDALQEILEAEGYAVTTGILDVESDSPISVQGAIPDLVLLNNDLSDGPLPDLGVPVMPPPQMGWYQRRKSNHFRAAQPFIDAAAELLDIDPWLLSANWFVSEEKCLEKETCRTLLAAEVDDFLSKIQSKYDQYGIEGKPTLFVKNDAGTYGLGILEITSGEELLHLSNRKMNKLTYGKGGVDAIDFLIQEGVPSALNWDGMVVEPVAYCANGRVGGWFYRANAKKGEIANLNTPSSIFLSPNAIQDDSISRRRNHWHMLVAEISMLAMAEEAKMTR
ncbi:MAG: glutamate--cysteine ligase [Candidatus Thermoplasmatota archaeon]|nr:glutamate--cysteine ligase [Candidatus Thermoplasmatota archaeon]